MGRIGMSGPGESDRRVDDAATSEGDMDRPAGGLIEEPYGRGEPGRLGLGDARLGDPAGGLIEELAGRVEMGRIGSGDAATSGGDDSGSSIAIRRTLLDCLSSFNKTFSGARVFRLRSCGWRLKTT